MKAAQGAVTRNSFKVSVMVASPALSFRPPLRRL
jgi:hypothetical protein